MSDKRFAIYLSVLSAEGRKRLIRARIRDILPEEFESLVTVSSSPRLKDEGSNLSLLPQESRSALDKLAGEMARDTELHDWIMQFVRKVC